MKFLQVIPSVNPEAGGTVEGIKQLQMPLEARGVSVETVCCDDPDALWLSQSGLGAVHAMGPSASGYAYAPGLLPWLRQNAKRYDALIVNGLWQYPGLATRQAAMELGVPYFVFTHGMLDPWFKRTYPLKHFKKWLYWPWAEYRVLRDARNVIFTCEEERLLARQSFWLYKAQEAVTTYGTSSPPENGAELKEKFLNSNPELRGKRICLFLGRIHEKKGCDLLIEAFARMNDQPGLHLVMAGPNHHQLAVDLRTRADELGMHDRVTWPGMLQGEAKWGAYFAAEVFCLPSHQENFGIVVAEALACGKPVLISNKVNIWREILSDKAGFVDEDTVAGTLRNLQAWLALSPQAMAEMAARASLCFQRRFHIDRAAEQLMNVISSRLEK